MGLQARPARTARRGGALLAVLWLSAALGAVAFSLANTVRGEIDRASTELDGTRAHYLAAGAVQRAILHLSWARTYPNSGYAPPGYVPLWYEFPSGAAKVEVIPETAKLNINRATPEHIFRLVAALSGDYEQARLVATDIAMRRDPKFILQNPTFLGPAASFQEVEELLAVRGVTTDLFYGGLDRIPQGPGAPPRLVPRPGLIDCVSVYGQVGSYDAMNVQPAVLASEGVPPDRIAAFLQMRAMLPPDPKQLGPFFRQLSDITGGRVMFAGKSMFTIRATARPRVPAGGLSDLRRSVSALVKFMVETDEVPYYILRWYDNASRPAVPGNF